MATVVRRRKPELVAPAEPTVRQPIRMQDAVRAGKGEVFGVDPVKAQAALDAYLSQDRGEQRPYCVCTSIAGWAFDCQVGVYLHAVPECWKPSKAYYEAALRAGVLGEVPVK